MSVHREVGVLVRRSSVDNPWIDHVWTPVDVLAQAPQTEPWTRLGEADGGELFYAGAAVIELHTSETGHYRDNLTDGAPFVWVALRETAQAPGLELAAVTADPTEGESLFESGLTVGKAPMPPDIAAWVAAFVDEHHVERAFLKRKRDKTGPDPRKVPGGGRGPGGGVR